MGRAVAGGPFVEMESRVSVPYPRVQVFHYYLAYVTISEKALSPLLPDAALTFPSF